jgi:hypothetical protein
MLRMLQYVTFPLKRHDRFVFAIDVLCFAGTTDMFAKLGNAINTHKSELAIVVITYKFLLLFVFDT